MAEGTDKRNESDSSFLLSVDQFAPIQPLHKNVWRFLWCLSYHKNLTHGRSSIKICTSLMYLYMCGAPLYCLYWCGMNSQVNSHAQNVSEGILKTRSFTAWKKIGKVWWTNARKDAVLKLVAVCVPRGHTISILYPSFP